MSGVVAELLLTAMKAAAVALAAGQVGRVIWRSLIQPRITPKLPISQPDPNLKSDVVFGFHVQNVGNGTSQSPTSMSISMPAKDFVH